MKFEKREKKNKILLALDGESGGSETLLKQYFNNETFSNNFDVMYSSDNYIIINTSSRDSVII
jgi:hypothetical protein